MHVVRHPAVAGLFYEGEADKLNAQVSALLSHNSDENATAEIPEIKALIVPHAGYIFSGEVAASAYKLIAQQTHYKRVVLLGPSHRVPLEGVALPESSVFETPIGAFHIDDSVREPLLKLPQVTVNESAHAYEHSLEVQLPFVRLCLGDIAIVPLVVGRASPFLVAEVLDLLYRPDTLMIISTDLSHYLSYDDAQSTDSKTADSILHLQSDLSSNQACGCMVLNGLAEWAKGHDLTVHRITMMNSGDTAGDKAQVVGYGSFYLS